MIPALVLTAGLATRLRPLSCVRAKAALPVADLPLILRIVRSLTRAGVSDLVLNLHHLPHSITTLTGDGSHLGARIRYSWEMPVLGSAGGPRRALPLLDSEDFLIVNGDTLTDVDLHALIADHRASGALVTMAAVPNDEPHKYGGVVLDEEGAAIRFSRAGDGTPCAHFVGVQVVSAQAFAAVPDNVPYESTRQLYPDLIRDHPGSVRGFVTSAEFFDIGTVADYLHTSLTLAAREGASLTGAATVLGAGARVTQSVLWNNVNVGPGARLDQCVVADGVTIPAGAGFSRVTIRQATSELADSESQVGNLAVAPIVGVAS